jgi:hypothetical protein
MLLSVHIAFSIYVTLSEAHQWQPVDYLKFSTKLQSAYSSHKLNSSALFPHSPLAPIPVQI